MARIAPVARDKMDEAQRRLYDKVMSQRGRVRGPFDVLMHAPEIGDRLTDLVQHYHSDTRVPKNVKELAILTIARHYTAQYEWLVHEPGARKAGVPDAVIEAIRNRRAPEFSDPKEAVAYAMVNEIVGTRKIGDATYARAVELLGEPAVVELVTQIGFYIAIAVLLVSFQVDVPAGEKIPLAG
jgi:4-carboxymuconolactone decarboxylase